MDHLVFGVPDLFRGIELVEHRTGVRARLGGQHPGRGTHNALMSLGGRQYLEIIAIDPMQVEPSELLFPELKNLSEPRLIAWAVAVENLVETARRAAAQNIDTIGPLAGSRAQADGSLLSWQTLRISGPRAEGLPFFIEWEKGAAHPSQQSPSGCTLASFEVEHTDVEWMRHTLNGLGVDANVVESPVEVRLKARLQTPKGVVALR
jgi:Glyoxalase-like domain